MLTIEADQKHWTPTPTESDGSDPLEISTDPETEINPEQDRHPTDIELAIAAIDLRGGDDLSSLYRQPLVRISELRTQMSLINTILGARYSQEDPENALLENPQHHHDDYVGHHEVVSRLSALGISFEQVGITQENQKLLHDTYEQASTRLDRIRYNPDNPKFLKWVIEKFGEHSPEHNYMLFLAAHVHLKEDYLTKEQLSKDGGKPNYELFQDLFLDYTSSPDFISDSSAVPDVFDHLGLSAKESARFNTLVDRRRQLAQETRHLLHEVLPSLKRVLEETAKIELELSENYYIADIPSAIIEYAANESLNVVNEDSLPDPDTDIASAVDAYLRLAREYLKMKRAEEMRTDYGGTALRAVA